MCRAALNVLEADRFLKDERVCPSVIARGGLTNTREVGGWGVGHPDTFCDPPPSPPQPPSFGCKHKMAFLELSIPPSNLYSLSAFCPLLVYFFVCADRVELDGTGGGGAECTHVCVCVYVQPFL